MGLAVGWRTVVVGLVRWVLSGTRVSSRLGLMSAGLLGVVMMPGALSLCIRSSEFRGFL